MLLPDGRVLDRPPIAELAEAVGLQVAPEHDTYDVVVVGGGPTGLAAAVYGASEGLRTLLVEREATGGQAGTSSRIENYLGFPTGVSGDDLAARAREQAIRLGAEIIVTRSIESITPNDECHTVTLNGGLVLGARAVILATGVSYRALPAEGIDAFVGIGCFYGAARTEAAGMQGRDVILVGGGNSAGQAAVFFSEYANTRDDPDPRREPRGVDVAVPDRRARAQAERAGADGRGDHALRRRRAAGAGRDPEPR